jgi:hypothetical protein
LLPAAKGRAMSKYPALNIYAGLVLTVGAVVGIVGILAILWGLLDLLSAANNTNPFAANAFESTVGVMKIAGGFFLVAIGTLQLLIGESVKVFRGIEANTARTVELLGGQSAVVLEPAATPIPEDPADVG